MTSTKTRKRTRSSFRLTSATLRVDPEAEARVMAALREAARGKRGAR